MFEAFAESRLHLIGDANAIRSRTSETARFNGHMTHRAAPRSVFLPNFPTSFPPIPCQPNYNFTASVIFHLTTCQKILGTCVVGRLALDRV